MAYVLDTRSHLSLHTHNKSKWTKIIVVTYRTSSRLSLWRVDGYVSEINCVNHLDGFI